MNSSNFFLLLLLLCLFSCKEPSKKGDFMAIEEDCYIYKCYHNRDTNFYTLDYYFKDSVLVKEKNYYHQKLNGLSFELYNNKLSSIEVYNNDTLSAFIYSYLDGRKKGIGYLNSYKSIHLTNDSNDIIGEETVMFGDFIFWHSNGVKNIEAFMKDSLTMQKSIWDEKGTLIQSECLSK